MPVQSASFTPEFRIRVDYTRIRIRTSEKPDPILEKNPDQYPTYFSLKKIDLSLFSFDIKVNIIDILILHYLFKYGTKISILVVQTGSGSDLIQKQMNIRIISGKVKVKTI